MRRTDPLAALAAVSLLLAACDDGSAPADAVDTVAVGSLPGDLPTVATTVATTPATDEPVTTDPTETTERETTEPGTTEPGTTEPGTTEPGTTEPGTTEPATTEPARTVFLDVLDGLVEGDRPDRIDTVTVGDDTGRLRMAVPRGWAQRRTEPARFPDGSEAPSLAASPDLTAFLDGYSSPGLTALVVAADPDEALDAYAFGEDCAGRRRSDLLSDDATGRFDVWESCGGTSNDIVTLAVQPDGADESVLLLIQVVAPEDLAAIDAALATLTLSD